MVQTIKQMSTTTKYIKTEKQLVPELRFSQFNDYWEKYRMEQLADCYDGTHQTPTYVESGVPFVSVENVKSYARKSKFITKEAFDKDFKTKPKKGDVIMTRITAGIIGMTSIVENDNDLAYYVSVALIRKKKDIGSSFLAHRIESEGFKRELHKRIIHVAFPKKINLGDLQKCVTYTPTLPEQQKIASFLSAVDEKIQQLTKKKKLLEQYKKGVMQQLFSGQLRFKDENGNPYPDWEEKQLGEVLTIGSGRDHKHLATGDIPVFGTGGYMRSVNEKLYSGETVFIGRKGTIDKPFYFKGDFWTVDTLFYTHKFIDVLPKFIYAIFQQVNWKLHNEASGVPSLSKSTIEKIKFDFPVIEEQQKIATYLSSIDTKIESVKNQITQTQTFKKGLLQQLFV